MNRAFLAGLVVLGAASIASADGPELYCTGFEPPDYAPGGLAGQDEWFIPVAGSIDYNVIPYGGPIAPNPNGGSHYVSGAATVDNFGRAQHAASFVDGTQYVLAYDINVLPWTGKPPSVNNIGSFSLQNSATARSTQSLFTWSDLNDPGAGWTMSYLNIAMDGSGANTFVSPGPEFQNLTTNHWYRQSLTVDFATNQLLNVSITDLATNMTTSVDLATVYLTGGATNPGGLTMPDAIRLFSGGGALPPTPGNITLWDNVCIQVIPAPATGVLALAGLGFLSRRRRS